VLRTPVPLQTTSVAIIYRVEKTRKTGIALSGNPRLRMGHPPRDYSNSSWVYMGGDAKDLLRAGPKTVFYGFGKYLMGGEQGGDFPNSAMAV
jgi:hypothetical protein